MTPLTAVVLALVFAGIVLNLIARSYANPNNPPGAMWPWKMRDRFRGPGFPSSSRVSPSSSSQRFSA